MTTLKTLNGVDKQTAEKMIKTYAAKHSGPEGVTKSIWFDLDRLDTILTMLKAERILANEQDKRYGIRFYFGTYGPGVTHININGNQRKYEHKDTLLLVSTKQGEKAGEGKVNVDYFSDLSEKLKTLPIENHGELCPEDCGGTDPEFS